MKSSYCYIETENLSTAWAQAFLNLMESGVERLSPLTISINVENSAGAPEVGPIRSMLNQKLIEAGESGVSPIDTVSSTIFPVSLWNRNQHRDQLYSKFLKIMPRILSSTIKNRNGTYFQRLIAFGATIEDVNGVNQLEHVIRTYLKGNHRVSALQASIFDPVADHTDQRMRGFPCLQHVQFVPEAKTGTLMIVGVYATQHLFEKAYGNYLGLYNLGTFMAQEMGLRLNRVMCIASQAKLGNCRKSALHDLEQAVQASLTHL